MEPRTPKEPVKATKLHILDIYTRDNRDMEDPPVHLGALDFEDLSKKFRDYAYKNREIEDYLEEDDEFDKIIKDYVDGISKGKPDCAPELNIAYIMKYSTMNPPQRSATDRTSQLHILDIYTRDNCEKDDPPVRLVALNLRDLSKKFQEYTYNNRRVEFIDGFDVNDELDDAEFNEIVKGIVKGILKGKSKFTPRIHIASSINYLTMNDPRKQSSQLKDTTIIIDIKGGALVDVNNLPHGYDYVLIDHDITCCDPRTLPDYTPPGNTTIEIEIKSGVLIDVANFPHGYNYILADYDTTESDTDNDTTDSDEDKEKV